jgi:two-component system sensor kinase FixL
MSYVTVLWSMTAAAAVIAAVVQGVVWVLDRESRANLALAIVALSIAAIVPTELGMMYSGTAQEWGEWARWCHIPIYFAIVGTVAFVQLYMGTGRSWLAWAIVAVRTLILVRNLAVEPNFNFDSISTLEHIRFLGEEVAVVGDAVVSPWQWLATAAGLLFLLFVLDASITLWRRNGPDDRRKALTMGVSLSLFVAASLVHTQLLIWGLVHVPVMIALPFIVPLGAMSFELSRDILRAPKLARDLGESERRLELAASAAGLGLWVWDLDRSRMWATERACSLVGLPKETAVDPQRWLERVHPEDAARVWQAIDQAISTGGEYSMEYRVCTPEAQTRWVSAQGRSASDSGRRRLMRGVIRDITPEVQARDESEELRRELAHAGRVTMLGQLASALAHELSQPLGAILRNIEAAEMILGSESPDLEEIRAIVADVHSADRRACDVIERLRALLKRRRLDFQPVALESLVHEVSTLVGPDALEKRVTLQCDVTSGLPRVRGDRVHLSQVLINLILNGVDAALTSNEPIRKVIIAAHEGGRQTIEVAVTDSGTGILPEHVDRVFEPFFTTKPGGMGMGLAVSRTIIEAHGGRLWAENNVAGGATFRFTLPVDGESRR